MLKYDILSNARTQTYRKLRFLMNQPVITLSPQFTVIATNTLVSDINYNLTVYQQTKKPRKLCYALVSCNNELFTVKRIHSCFLYSYKKNSSCNDFCIFITQISI